MKTLINKLAVFIVCVSLSISNLAVSAEAVKLSGSDTVISNEPQEISATTADMAPTSTGMR